MTKTTTTPTAARKIMKGMPMGAPPRSIIVAGRSQRQERSPRADYRQPITASRLPENPAPHPQDRAVDGDRGESGQHVGGAYPQPAEQSAHHEEKHGEGEGAHHAAPQHADACRGPL